MSEISASAQEKKSRSGTIRSASCPTSMRPLRPSSLENQVTFSVHIRSAVSRSRQLRFGYSRRPPTVVPVTSHASETQGLYDATRVASVPAEILTPLSSILFTGGVDLA